MSVVHSAPIILVLEGHLTGKTLRRELDAATAKLTESPACMVVDCATMTGYDSEARLLFVQWNKEHRGSVERVAIVTTNRIWRMVIAAMSLASRQSMRAFDGVTDAHRWAESGDQA